MSYLKDLTSDDLRLVLQGVYVFGSEDGTKPNTGSFAEMSEWVQAQRDHRKACAQELRNRRAERASRRGTGAGAGAG